MMLDLPEPDAPARISVSPELTRKLTSSSALPRAGSQLSDTFSNATVIPCAATLRTSSTGAGGGRSGSAASASAAPVACMRSW